MRYRKLTADGDYSFGSGQLDFYRDTPQAVGQAAKTRMLLWIGEWFLDIEEGTPFMQGIFGKKTKEQADTTIQDRVSGTEGFVGIDAYESVSDPDNRRLAVTMTIDTIYGQTTVEVESQSNY